MSPSKRYSIAKTIGKAAHVKSRAHQFIKVEARKAGKIGGIAKKIRKQ